MKIKVDRNSFLDLLGKAQNIVEKRNTMPILVNVLLDAKKDRLKLFATDLEVSLMDEIPCFVDKDGQIAVDAKQLFQIVKELGEGLVEIYTKENHWIEIKSNKSVFNIVSLPPQEYPLFPKPKTEVSGKVRADVLLDMIHKTIYSVSNDETRYHLNGVYFEQVKAQSGTKLRMVATDGHRLSVIDRETKTDPKEANSTSGVIIPKKGLSEIRKLLETDRSSEIEMAIEGSQLIFKKGTALLMIRLIEGRYPNYQQLIPQNLKRSITVSRDQIVGTLRRVSLLSNQKSKGVTLQLNDGVLKITSNNPELGDAREEMDVEYKGEELKIGFNARYLLDILNAIEDDSIVLQFNDQLSPGLVQPKNDSSYKCIVMPMRI